MTDNYDAIPAVRRSLLWELKKSPAHFKWAAEGEGIDEETPALRLGTIIHMCVLEFDKYLDHYRVLPRCDRRTKEGKARHQEVLDKLEPGQEVITWDEHDQAIQMRAAIMDDPYASKFFSQFRPEQIYVWTDPETGEACKIKADLVVVIDGQDYIIDFKTTDSCQDGHFER
ncbi:MAG: PD-(D/E)XK nuclease-like domain-containing protein, partial [Mogibacterium sp.]|nr:PD-(D/E)XK nuclease-like domain-containing protein [Mogibacterium sp.]